MLDELTLWPMARSAVASLSWLLETHRNGRIGSPIVAGSSNRCKSSNSVGSLTVNRGVPPPLRRTSPVKEPGFRKSFRPQSCSGRPSSRARPPQSRRSPPPSPPPPRSTAGVARPAKAEARQTGRAGMIRLSSSRYRRSPRTRESAKQPMPVKSQIPNRLFLGVALFRGRTTLSPRRQAALRLFARSSARLRAGRDRAGDDPGGVAAGLRGPVRQHLGHDAARLPRPDRAAIRQGAARLVDGSGIPTEEVLAEMRQADPPVQYLVGTQ